MKDFGPMPNDLAQQALWRFVTAANLDLLHPLDIKRFDEFTITAYENGNQWKSADVETQLTKYGVQREIVKDLLVRFGVGIEVLSRQQEMKQNVLSDNEQP